MTPDRRLIPYLPAVALSLLMGLATSAGAGGLRCSVGEVVIENLAIGHTYSLKALANLPLSVTSTSDGPVRVAIEPLVPDAVELRPGTAAIPDRRWATALPDTLDLEPQQTQAAEMSLAIPNDRSLLGRRFQVTFWTHTLPREGELLAYGLKSRIIFSISPTADADETQPTGNLSLSLQPAELTFKPMSSGKTYRLEKSSEHPLTVRNTSDHRVSVALQAMSFESAGATLRPDDAELLKAAQVRFEPDSLTLEPGEERTITGAVTMGSHKSPRGKNLVCVISAAVSGQAVQTQIYSRLRAQAQ